MNIWSSTIVALGIKKKNKKTENSCILWRRLICSKTNMLEVIISNPNSN